MITHSFYFLETGMFTGAVVVGPKPENLPPGRGLVEGDWPADRYRVVNGQPVQYVPDKPPLTETHDHEWDPVAWRWNPVPTVAGLWQLIRHERARRIAVTDWTELPSVRALHGAQWAAAWDGYRQALRDITGQSDPNAIQWPDPPEA
jgi:hypothetical protein